MAITWHRQAMQALVQPEGVAYWRATNYRRLGKSLEPTRIEAAPDAEWTRFTPFATYRPTSRTRDLEAGPHLDFLKLKNLRRTNPDLYRTALQVFTTTYGLLGLFYERYSAPILPEKKIFVLPEAVIDKGGRLRRVDPATRGVELLLDLLERQQLIENKEDRNAFLTRDLGEVVAAP